MRQPASPPEDLPLPPARRRRAAPLDQFQGVAALPEQRLDGRLAALGFDRPGGAHAPVVAGRIGKARHQAILVTRSTSSSVVSPASALASPSSSMVSIPPSTAAASMALSLARSSSRRRSASLMTSSSLMAVRPAYPVFRHAGQPTFRRNPARSRPSAQSRPHSAG